MSGGSRTAPTVCHHGIDHIETVSVAPGATSYTVSDCEGNVEFRRTRFPHIKRKVAIAYGLCCAISSY